MPKGKRKWIIDTNVPVVANGRSDRERPLSKKCRSAAVEFLRRFLDKEACVVVDAAGEIQAEYERYLRHDGQPGVGDRFFLEFFCNPSLSQKIDLPKREDGEYADLPQPVIDAGFDRGDRKFAALAKREGIPVANAVDSDWVDAIGLLTSNGIHVEFLCGCNPDEWFLD